MKPLFLSIALLILTACGPAPLGRLNPGASFPYDIVTDSDMHATASKYSRRHAQPPALRGLYSSEDHSPSGWVTMGFCAPGRILELHAGSAPWVPAHEAAHLADRMGGNYRAAIAALTPPNPNEHMLARLRSMEEIADGGSNYWRTIRNRWGNVAVVHGDIIARLDAEEK